MWTAASAFSRWSENRQYRFTISGDMPTVLQIWRDGRPGDAASPQRFHAGHAWPGVLQWLRRSPKDAPEWFMNEMAWLGAP
jgi:hypothetical protein